MSNYPCSTDPDEVLEKISGAKADADRFSKFVNGGPYETVALKAGGYTPTVRNVVRLMKSAAAEIDGADVSGKFVASDGSSVLRMLGERFADIVNVKDYGAQGDGETNDSDAIDRAITEAKNRIRNKTTPLIFFPAGTYIVSRPVNFTNFNARVSVIGDGAEIKASAAVAAVFYFDGCWGYLNEVSGFTINMDRKAAKGIQITNDNHRFYMNNVRVQWVGAGTGIMLGADNTSGRDGMAHFISNIVIADWVASDSNENGSELYNGTGINVKQNDCYFVNIEVGCVRNPLCIVSGGHMITNIHVWQHLLPASTKFGAAYAIWLNGGSWFGNVYIDNYAHGVWVQDNKAITIDNLFYIKTNQAVIHPIIFSVSRASQIKVDWLYVYNGSLREDDPICITVNRGLGDSESVYNYVPYNGTINIRHDIKETKYFHLIDTPFNAEMVATKKTLTAVSMQTLNSGFYFLGYITMDGTSAGIFDIGLSGATSRVKVKRYGSDTWYFSAENNINVGGRPSSTYLLIGDSVRDSVYQSLDVYPVYLYFGGTTSSWTGVKIGFYAENANMSFYMAAAAYMDDLLVASPSILGGVSLSGVEYEP